MVFARSTGDNLASLVKKIDALVADNSEKKMASFINILGKNADEAAASAAAGDDGVRSDEVHSDSSSATFGSTQLLLGGLGAVTHPLGEGLLLHRAASGFDGGLGRLGAPHHLPRRKYWNLLVPLNQHQVKHVLSSGGIP